VRNLGVQVKKPGRVALYWEKGNLKRAVYEAGAKVPKINARKGGGKEGKKKTKALVATIGDNNDTKRGKETQKTRE